MIATLARKLRGSAAVAIDVRGQRAVPYYSRERLVALRDARLRRIVAYAARAVPYYRDLFAREGIDPRSIERAEDLDLVPLTDRQLVRTRPELFLARAAPARGALSFLTSGSTGKPIEVHHDRRSLLSNIAFGEREREPVNKACGSFRPKEVYVGYETSTFKKVIGFYEESVLFPVRPRRRFVSLLEPVESVVAVLDAERPDVLVGYGGWMDTFFKTVAACGLRPHLPKLVMYMGEALPHGSRTFIEERFGVPVMSRYNAVESFKIGFYCEKRSGFHIHEDICHVRIVSPDGRTATPGEQGQIVLSNLVNRGTVLLNYPIGDVASMSDVACSCGRTLRVLSELEGRVEDIISLPDGRFVHPRAVWQIFKADRSIIQYRLTQHEPRRFELELVTADEPAFATALERALPALGRLLGPDSVVEARREAELARPPGGKFRAVASRCGRSRAS